MYQAEVAQKLSALSASGRTPPVVLDTLRFGSKEFFVAREDLLPGGTKQRAALPYVLGLKQAGFREFVYASPFAGFAQVALAASCSVAGTTSVIFAQINPLTGGAHSFTKLAQSYGAKIVLCQTLAEAEQAAINFVQKSYQKKIPLGFDDPAFCHHLKYALGIEWSLIATTIPAPRQVWVSLGSGTLSKTLRQVLPQGTRLRVVDVRVLGQEDERIVKIKNLPNVTYEQTLESFQEEAILPPPIPSNVHYDSKVWRHLASEALDGDLWWNVAR